MSKLDELIAELCPDGVVFKRFDEVCTLHARIGWQRLTRAEYKNSGEYMLITGTDFTPMHEINYKSCVYVSEDRYIQDPKIQLKDGDILITKDGTLGKVAQVNSLPMPATLNGGVFVVRSKDGLLLPRYILHFLLSGHFQKVVDRQKTGSTISHLTQSLFSRLQIPVPPLEVQREIVHILDSFTLLTAELTAELTARKKQYEFYRDELLSAKKNIPIVKLGDIATEFYRGSGIKRDEVTDTGIPCVRYGEIYTTYNTWFDKCVSYTKLDFVKSPKYFENGDILFAITGESVEDIAKSVAYIGHEKCLAGGDIVVMKHNQNPRYLAHVLATTEARMQKSKGKVKSKVVHSNVPSIKEIQIPLPSLEIQEKYANVLDNFEAICTDLNIGLPAEIEARQKQYEYYRDLLLTFAETGNMLETDRQTDRQTDRAERN